MRTHGKYFSLPFSVRVALVVFGLSLLVGCFHNTRTTEEPLNMEQATTNFVHKNVTIKYNEVGDGPPIILLHGFGASSYTWRYIRGPLSKSNRVICFDLKGFGDSDKPDDPYYSASDQAELIAAFIEQRNMDNVTIVGNSFGGAVGLNVFEKLSKRSNRIRRIVLIDSVAPNQVLPNHVRLATVPWIAGLGISIMPANSLAKGILKGAFYDETKISPDAINVYAGYIRLPGAKKAFVRTVRHIFSDQPPQLWEHLNSIHLPVLIVWGEGDKIIPVRNGRKFQQDIPGARSVIIPECGHMPQEEKPKETTEAILQFLRDTDG